MRKIEKHLQLNTYFKNNYKPFVIFCSVIPSIKAPFAF